MIEFILIQRLSEISDTHCIYRLDELILHVWYEFPSLPAELLDTDVLIKKSCKAKLNQALKKWLERLSEWNLVNAKYVVNVVSFLHKIH